MADEDSKLTLQKKSLSKKTISQDEQAQGPTVPVKKVKKIIFKSKDKKEAAAQKPKQRETTANG